MGISKTILITHDFSMVILYHNFHSTDNYIYTYIYTHTYNIYMYIYMYLLEQKIFSKCIHEPERTFLDHCF